MARGNGRSNVCPIGAIGATEGRGFVGDVIGAGVAGVGEGGGAAVSELVCGLAVVSGPELARSTEWPLGEASGTSVDRRLDANSLDATRCGSVVEATVVVIVADAAIVAGVDAGCGCVDACVAGVDVGVATGFASDPDVTDETGDNGATLGAEFGAGAGEVAAGESATSGAETGLATGGVGTSVFGAGVESAIGAAAETGLTADDCVGRVSESDVGLEAVARCDSGDDGVLSAEAFITCADLL